MTRCLVFGGTGAVGGAVVHALVASGARVAFTYHRHEDAARKLAEEVGATALPVDLASVPDVERAVDAAAEALGELDAFVQAAGVAVTIETSEPRPHQGLADVDERAYDRMLDVVAKGTFFACRRMLRVMKSGNIVLLGSIDGVKTAPSPVHYAAAHGALAGMTHALSKELGPRGIRVNVIAPGPLEAGHGDVIPVDIRDEFVRHNGLKRVGRLAEVAAVVRWFALENTYVTGRTISVDGGL